MPKGLKGFQKGHKTFNAKIIDEARADERKRIIETVEKMKKEETHDKGIKNEDCLCYREALNSVLNILK